MINNNVPINNKLVSNYILFWSKHSRHCKNLFDNINFDIVSKNINFKTICVDNKYIRNILKSNNKYKIYCVPTLLIINNQDILKYENIRVFKWFISNLSYCYKKNIYHNNILPQGTTHSEIGMSHPDMARGYIGSEMDDSIINNVQRNKNELLIEYQNKINRQNNQQQKLQKKLLEKQLEAKIRKELEQEMLLKYNNSVENFKENNLSSQNEVSEEILISNLSKNNGRPLSNTKNESKKSQEDISIYDRHFTPKKKIDSENDLVNMKQGLDNAGLNSAIRNNNSFGPTNHKTQLNDLENLENNTSSSRVGRNASPLNEEVSSPNLITNNKKRLSTIEQARQIEKGRTKLVQRSESGYRRPN